MALTSEPLFGTNNVSKQSLGLHEAVANDQYHGITFIDLADDVSWRFPLT